MIQSLDIKNYALITSLRVDFSKGLTIITGETGAGKSILLGALGLIMGKRADTKVLFNPEEKCVVEAKFNIKNYSLQAYFEENDLDFEEELLIRREISPAGKSRAFVNDTPVNLSVLQELSDNLLDLHQQFDMLDIHKVSFQVRMVDALADHKTLLASYEQTYKEWQKKKSALQNLIQNQNQKNQELDFLQYQIKEFDEAKLQEGELEELESQLEILNSAEDIKRVSTLFYHSLDESDNSITNRLRELIRESNSLSEVDQRFGDMQQRLTQAIEEMRDIAQTCEQIADSTEHEPKLIEKIQDRLSLIYRLMKKHHTNFYPELIEIHQNLVSKLKGITGGDQEIALLQSEIKELEAALANMAEDISKNRKSVIPNFESQIHQLLAQLGMENAKIQISCTPAPQYGPTGKDVIEYLFAPNKGSAFLPLKDIASGGEISRLTLCIKSLVAAAIPLPTLIFDEIDTGISGEVAYKMGKILSHLADDHQIISITHAPQIAAQADLHYFVYKQDTPERTVTAVRSLRGEDRIQELAKMLSGNPPSKSAIENAKELIKHSF